MWFRLILIGVGGTFQKPSPLEPGGGRPAPPLGGRSGVGPIRGPLRPGGALILLDASFLGAKPRSLSKPSGVF
jgi:hypothetical protein